jgi:hypothetical protein
MWTEPIQPRNRCGVQACRTQNTISSMAGAPSDESVWKCGSGACCDLAIVCV